MKRLPYILQIVIILGCVNLELFGITTDESQGQDAYELVNAAYKGDKEKVEALLASGVNANVTQLGGKTALINAALQSHIDIVQVLLEKGADADLADRQKTTPLIAAVLSYANNQDESQIKKMIEMLIAKGANVNAQNIGGQTALMLAGHEGLLEVVKVLLAAGADCKIENAFGQKAKDLINENCPCYALVSGQIQSAELLD